MARVREYRKKGIVVVDRINILKTYISKLTTEDRLTVKDEIEKTVLKLGNDAVKILQNITPEKKESSDIMEHRVDGWKKYGFQSYLKSTSDKPSERWWGMTTKSGWIAPVVDYSYSGTNLIGVNLRLANNAPQAPAALLGEFKSKSWYLPKNKMHGGRKAMMWMGDNGKPVFRWAQNGSIKINAPKEATLKHVVDKGVNILTMSKPAIIDAIAIDLKNNIEKEFVIR